MYGKTPGEIVASCRVAGATGSASLIGLPFNVASVASSAPGAYQVTLQDGVDTTECSTHATPVTAGNIATVNEGNADTDTVKEVRLTDAAGAPIVGGFCFSVVRTAVEP